jgi:hypothetical protein
MKIHKSAAQVANIMTPLVFNFASSFLTEHLAGYRLRKLGPLQLREDIRDT